MFSIHFHQEKKVNIQKSINDTKTNMINVLKQLNVLNEWTCKTAKDVRGTTMRQTRGLLLMLRSVCCKLITSISNRETIFVAKTGLLCKTAATTATIIWPVTFKAKIFCCHLETLNPTQDQHFTLRRRHIGSVFPWASVSRMVKL